MDRRKRHNDVYALRSPSLAKRLQVAFVEHDPRKRCGLNHHAPVELRTGIEIENEAIRMVKIRRCRVPRVDFDRVELGELQQGFSRVRYEQRRMAGMHRLRQLRNGFQALHLRKSRI